MNHSRRLKIYERIHVMKPDFFKGNRKKIIESLQGGVIVLSAYSQLQRGNDAAHMFEQEANFWYLTGINVADWWVIIDGSTNTEWLVAPETDAMHEIFDGSLSHESASASSGIKKIISKEEGLSTLRSLAKHHSLVHTIDTPQHAEHFSFSLNPSISDLKKTLQRIFNTVNSCTKELNRLRSVKQLEEIRAMKRAIGMTTDAFENIKSNFGSYNYEYEIEADFTHFFRSRGSKSHAYDPIIASGKNACTLHYNQNQSKLHSNQLVLMDVGVRYEGYAADITRTYSRGNETQRQAAVHAAVDRAHHEIIKLIKPELGVEEYSASVDAIMKRELIELSLMRDETDDIAYRKYFPHAISHGLGIDVHDSLGAPRYFQAGMVLTVEPGIYIPEENIGVRIEDDILISETGRINMSAKLSTATK